MMVMSVLDQHVYMDVCTARSCIVLDQHVYMDVCSASSCIVLDQHVYMDVCSASSLKQQFTGRHDALLGHIILIPS